MRILISGGAKTRNIVEQTKSSFEASGDKFVVVEYLEDVESVYERGDYFEKALIIEPSITNDGKLTYADNELEIRKKINTFANKMRNRGVNCNYTFLAQDEDIANLIDEEILAIESDSAVVFKKPRYTVSFFVQLIKTEAHDLPDDLIYKPELIMPVIDDNEDLVISEITDEEVTNDMPLELDLNDIPADDIFGDMDGEIVNNNTMISDDLVINSGENIDNDNIPDDLETLLDGNFESDTNDNFEYTSGFENSINGEIDNNEEFNQGFNEEGFNEGNEEFSEEFNQGFNEEGFNEGNEEFSEEFNQGFNEEGFSEGNEEFNQGFSEGNEEFNEGFSEEGFSEEGLSEGNEEYNEGNEEYNEGNEEYNEGFNENGFNEEGFNEGFNENGFNEEGFNEGNEEFNQGFNENGFNEGNEEFNEDFDEELVDEDFCQGNEAVGNHFDENQENLTDEVIDTDGYEPLEQSAELPNFEVDVQNTEDTELEQYENDYQDSTNNEQLDTEPEYYDEETPVDNQQTVDINSLDNYEYEHFNELDISTVDSENYKENNDTTNTEVQDAELYSNDNELYSNDNELNNNDTELYSNDNELAYSQMEDAYIDSKNEQMEKEEEELYNKQVIDQDDVELYGINEDTEEEKNELTEEEELYGTNDTEANDNQLQEQYENNGTVGRVQKRKGILGGLFSKVKGAKVSGTEQQERPVESNIVEQAETNTKNTINLSKLKESLRPFAMRGNSIVVTGFGGCGTSTIAYNIANIINQLGYTVLVVDMDTIGKTQSYISKDCYESMEPDGANLMAAVNSSNGINTQESIVKQGFHLLTMGLGSDTASVDDILHKEKISRFANVAKSSANFIIYDIPFEYATGYLSEITYTSDNLVVVADASNWGLTKMMINMCNIGVDDMQDTLFTRGQLVFNKYRGLSKLLGRKVNTGLDIVKVLDNKVRDLIGEDPELHFEDMHIAGILNDEPNMEQFWFESIQYTDTKKGQIEYLKLIESIILNK